MAKRKQKLKVYRTPIGFHDAYVAAPSQKAALEAWGSDSNLFTAGTAELVTDPALIKEALERPGEVIKRLRGTREEQMAALGKAPKAPPKNAAGSRIKSGMKTGGAKRPKPSRAGVEKAEAAIAELERRHAAERGAIEREERALAKRRRAMEEKHRAALDKARAKRDAAEEHYRDAMREWGS